MSEQLITDAVLNRRKNEEISLWDKLFALWFRRLVYTQIWEDPEADLAALQLAPGATVVTISSGGCNALSYLTADPARVIAVDLNPAHLALLKLKLAGLQALPDYAAFWQFFGAADRAENAALYLGHLRGRLDDEARDFWDGRDLQFRRRADYFTRGFYRHGTLGGFIGFAHGMARLFGIDLGALIEPARNQEERRQALERIAAFFRSGPMRLLARSPALLFSLGIPPRQRELLAGPGGDLAGVLHQRFLKLATGFPPEENYFAWQALARRYPGPGNHCLPPYLKESEFVSMRTRAHRIEPLQANMKCFLEEAAPKSVNALVLLDAQDWMDDAEIAALWQAIDHAGAEDIRIIFRTAGAESPLDQPAFAKLQAKWQRDGAQSATGFAADRSGIYGGFHLYRRR